MKKKILMVCLLISIGVLAGVSFMLWQQNRNQTVAKNGKDTEIVSDFSAAEDGKNEESGSELATVAQINEWCSGSEAEAVSKSFLNTYSGVFNSMKMYSVRDGMISYSYNYIIQQEYQLSSDELTEAQIAKYKEADTAKQIQDGFEDFDSKGLKLDCMEYIYYNADGSLITDILCYRDGRVEAN